LADLRKQPLLLQPWNHTPTQQIVDLFAFLGQALTTHDTLRSKHYFFFLNRNSEFMINKYFYITKKTKLM